MIKAGSVHTLKLEVHGPEGTVMVWCGDGPAAEPITKMGHHLVVSLQVYREVLQSEYTSL